MQRQSTFWWLAALTGLTLALPGGNAAAKLIEQPPPGPPVQIRQQPPAAPVPQRPLTDMTQSNAWQLLQDIGALIQSVPKGPGSNAEDAMALSRFEDFNRAANRFYAIYAGSPQDPVALQASYQDLWEAYWKARPYFETIHRNPAAEAAIMRTRRLMQDLVGYYRVEDRAIEWDPHQLADAAADLRNLADRLNERAAAEAASGRVNPRDAARVQDATAAVRAFTDRVAATRGDPRALERDYEVMVDKLVDARAVLARFSMNTQGDYGNLWNLAQSLNYLAPETAVGGYPYESGPTYRRW